MRTCGSKARHAGPGPGPRHGDSPSTPRSTRSPRATGWSATSPRCARTCAGSMSGRPTIRAPAGARDRRPTTARPPRLASLHHGPPRRSGRAPGWQAPVACRARPATETGTIDQVAPGHQRDERAHRPRGVLGEPGGFVVPLVRHSMPLSVSASGLAVLSRTKRPDPADRLAPPSACRRSRRGAGSARWPPSGRRSR